MTPLRSEEATGRNRGSSGRVGGRHDPVRQRDGGGWVAWTTDPLRHDLAWMVRWHHDHGRSVVLYRDVEASPVGTIYLEGPLLFRTGGYWWDGRTWYRPDQVIDLAHEDYYHRPVPGAVTVTAADLLAAGNGDPARGTVLQVIDVDPDAPYEGVWDDDLATGPASAPARTWPPPSSISLRPNWPPTGSSASPKWPPSPGSPRRRCAPTPPAARPTCRFPRQSSAAAPSGPVPLPQNGPRRAERHPDVIGESVAVPGSDGRMVPVGEAELGAGLERSFQSALWDYRPVRNRWALRWRNPDSVREVAGSLAANTASYVLRSLIPGQDLILTVAKAVLWESPSGGGSTPAWEAKRSRCRIRVPAARATTTPSAGRSPACTAGSSATAPATPSPPGASSPATPRPLWVSPSPSPSTPWKWPSGLTRSWMKKPCTTSFVRVKTPPADADR